MAGSGYFACLAQDKKRSPLVAQSAALSLAGEDDLPGRCLWDEPAQANTTRQLSTVPAADDFQRDSYCAFCRQIQRSRAGDDRVGPFCRTRDGRELAACSSADKLLPCPRLYAAEWAQRPLYEYSRPRKKTRT